MLDINYLKMKKILLKEYRNTTVFIEVKGTFSTRFYIEKSRILINRNKLIIANENTDCTILLNFIKKVKVIDINRIELIGNDAQYVLGL